MQSLSSPRARLGAGLVLAAVAMAGSSAGAVDWASVPGKPVVLFYPGQASWEWALTQTDHSGAKNFREGKSCLECHTGEEADIGAAIVKGERLEPKPVAGKRGSIPAQVRFAHDGDKLHVRLEWPSAAAGAGAKGDPEFPAKVAVMFDDGKVNEAARAACWASCHDDSTGMASAGADTRTKYLARSRARLTRKGGGNDLKPQAELATMMAGGQFLEYWEAKLKPNAAAVAVDGYLLATREANKAPIVTVDAKLDGGKWVVVFSRKLDPANPAHKPITPGKSYAVGFAIHDDHAAGRHHHVSLNYSFALDGGKADFVALKK